MEPHELNAVTASRSEVRRYEGTVALVFEIAVEQLQGVKLDQPLTVLAAFDELSSIDRIDRALRKARNDAAAARARQEGEAKGCTGGT